MTTPILTNFPPDPILDLDPWVGQRSATFRFALSDAVSGELLGDIYPIRGATLTHDTSRTIKRTLSIKLGATDTASINPLTDRVNVYMIFPNGRKEPLGRYMFADTSRDVFTSGKLSQNSLTDEMFLVDQQILSGINGVNFGVSVVIANVLTGLPITFKLETTDLTATEAWSVGAHRGQILESLAVSGDFFSPWFDNNGELRFIRTFNPADKICDFDFDSGNKVMRSQIIETDDLLTAPNVIVVISNTSSQPGAVVGLANIPVTAPNSIPNRGFTIPSVQNLQLSDNTQASAVAQGLASRLTVFERVNLTTAPDPRHDSYNVIRWQGSNWLELAWSMALTEGGTMNHLLRKAYSG